MEATCAPCRGRAAPFEAARRIAASLIAPMEYTALVWAFVLSYAIWGDMPDRNVFVGAVLIIISGMGLLLGERLRWPVQMTRRWNV